MGDRTRSGVAFLVLVLAAANAANELVAATRAPLNVLVLISDDQRADTIHALGNAHIQTPNLDRLVKRGTYFSRAYCMGSTQGAVCLPSRAMLNSGRTLFHAPDDLAGVSIMAETFRQAGYDTFASGKWHNGTKSFARGFAAGDAIFFGGMGSQTELAVHAFDPSGEYPKSAAKSRDTHTSEMFAGAFARFLQSRDSAKPFFAYVAFTSPHDPRTPPAEYRALYDPAKLPLPANFLPEHPFDNGELKIRDEELAAWPRTPEVIREHLADYYGMISHLDAQVGHILDALDTAGAADDTIIVYTSDHGLAIGGHGLLGKQNLYDHSMNSPLILAGPGVPAGMRIDAMCYLLDIFPTICELTGVEIPSTVEGRGLKPVLTGQAERSRDMIFCAYREVQRSVRDERWKLIWYPKIEKIQVFDLVNDPHELHDLSEVESAASERERLRAMLDQAMRDADDPLAKE